MNLARENICGFVMALAWSGEKGNRLILFHLNGGPCRFGELKRRIGGISEKMLIQSLRELTDDGMLSRRDYREVPPRVDYEMTAFGHSLAHALVPLCDWGNQNRRRIEQLLAKDAARSA